MSSCMKLCMSGGTGGDVHGGFAWPRVLQQPPYMRKGIRFKRMNKERKNKKETNKEKKLLASYICHGDLKSNNATPPKKYAKDQYP
ncbi:hypothetical protein Hanom_Chr14g01270451 [Helianthus anomalus]